MMDPIVQKKLLEINQQFYDHYAHSFSATRGRVQPGVQRLMTQIDREAAILDVGCGNGTLAQALAASGFKGRYLGLDMSKGLLDKASNSINQPKQGHFQFRQVDLADPAWAQAIPAGAYDWLVCFAVLHHIPGEELRRQIVENFANLVTPKSRVAISVWQWQNSPRLRKRVHPWQEVGLKPEELDPGDVLLDWRAGETTGLRYVHTFTEEELRELAKSADFLIRESFYSDGKPGNLALYQIWQLEN